VRDSDVEMALLMAQTPNIRRLDIRSNTILYYRPCASPFTAYLWLFLLKRASEGKPYGNVHDFSYPHHLSVKLAGIRVHSLSSVFRLLSLRILDINRVIIVDSNYQKSPKWECKEGVSQREDLSITGVLSLSRSTVVNTAFLQGTKVISPRY
jgi:hypothetical protein